MTGLHLAQYRIDAELGRGGMGIVYRAADTKLNRTVALKVLPAAALSSDDDRARFVREAQAAARLSHPNVGHVYQVDEASPMTDDGRPVEGRSERRLFIAMEFIEGETLQAHVQKGPVKLTDAVNIAGQIAEALKAAHAKDIVHRDIKSANVMLTPGGVAKVLDFGLAKTSQSTMLTRMGSTLGTVAYMSPEQARGQEVDGRSDLYSLGTVLFEMVTGRLPFGGDYEQAILYGILNETPEPLTALRSGVPMELERITNKLLSKEAEYRYQTAADLVADLKSLNLGSGASRRSVAGMSAAGLSAGTMSAASPKVMLPKWMWGAFVAALVVVAAGTWVLARPQAVDPPLRRVELSFPELSDAWFPALSPGGAHLAVQGIARDGRTGIFVRDVATGRLYHVERTDEASWEMRYSPDGTKLAFMGPHNKGVFFFRLPDGLPERLTDFGRIAYWEDDGTVVMTDDARGGGDSYRVPISGATIEPIRLDSTGLRPRWGHVLKSGIPGTPRAFGLQVERINDQGNAAPGFHLMTADLASGEVVVLDSSAVNPEFVRGGFIVYNEDDDNGPLKVRPVDPGSGRFSGQAKDALPAGESAAWGNFTVSADGDLLYRKLSSRVATDGAGLWRFDPETGRADSLRLSLPVGLSPLGPVVSADGGTVWFTAVVEDGNAGTVYELDLLSGVVTQLTSGGAYTLDDVSTDGQTLYLTRMTGKKEDGTMRVSVVTMRRRVPGTEELLWPDMGRASLSPDGRRLVATHVVGMMPSGVSVMTLRDRSLVRLDTTASAASGFSADGLYVATTRFPEFQVQIHAVDGSSRFDFPIAWTAAPTFSPDGAYLYFIEVRANRVSRIRVRTDPTFSVIGEPDPMFYPWGGDRRLDVSADGKVFNTASMLVTATGAGDTPTFVWLQDWPMLLRQQFGR